MLHLPVRLVLASTSRYRRAQLQRLGLTFAAVAPPYEELPRPGLDARQLIDHHAREKALALQAVSEYAGDWILAADQGVVVDGPGGARLLGKPGTVEAAVAQLLDLADKTHELRTTVALALPGRPVDVRTSSVQVTMRPMDRQWAERYVALDEPLDCAGSYKIEAGGPWVIAACHGSDPTAIEGLPLLLVVEMLREALQYSESAEPAGAST
ncbi:MAG: Maf-like protein [Deltaproteobacteria bacterium]|nr:Maf-like protein [Deltaproteobacteria bacterium]